MVNIGGTDTAGVRGVGGVAPRVGALPLSNNPELVEVATDSDKVAQPSLGHEPLPGSRQVLLSPHPLPVSGEQSEAALKKASEQMAKGVATGANGTPVPRDAIGGVVKQDPRGAVPRAPLKFVPIDSPVKSLGLPQAKPLPQTPGPTEPLAASSINEEACDSLLAQAKRTQGEFQLNKLLTMLDDAKTKNPSASSLAKLNEATSFVEYKLKLHPSLFKRLATATNTLLELLDFASTCQSKELLKTIYEDLTSITLSNKFSNNPESTQQAYENLTSLIGSAIKADKSPTEMLQEISDTIKKKFADGADPTQILAEIASLPRWATVMISGGTNPAAKELKATQQSATAEIQRRKGFDDFSRLGAALERGEKLTSDIGASFGIQSAERSKLSRFGFRPSQDSVTAANNFLSTGVFLADQCKNLSELSQLQSALASTENSEWFARMEGKVDTKEFRAALEKKMEELSDSTLAKGASVQADAIFIEIGNSSLDDIPKMVSQQQRLAELIGSGWLSKDKESSAKELFSDLATLISNEKSELQEELTKELMTNKKYSQSEAMEYAKQICNGMYTEWKGMYAIDPTTDQVTQNHKIPGLKIYRDTTTNLINAQFTTGKIAGEGGMKRAKEIYLFKEKYGEEYVRFAKRLGGSDLEEAFQADVPVEVAAREFLWDAGIKAGEEHPPRELSISNDRLKQLTTPLETTSHQSSHLGREGEIVPRYIAPRKKLGDAFNLLSTKGPSAAFKACEGPLEATVGVHERGGVHKDIKLENIMVNSDGTGLMHDFGMFAKPQDSVAFGGTPGFIAPELLTGAATKNDPKMDMFSWGATLADISLKDNDAQNFINTIQLNYISKARQLNKQFSIRGSELQKQYAIDCRTMGEPAATAAFYRDEKIARDLYNAGLETAKNEMTANIEIFRQDLTEYAKTQDPKAAPWDLIIRLLSPDPTQRPTAAEALTEYRAFLATLT